MTKAGFLRISKEAHEILSSKPSYEKLARAAVEEYARDLRELDALARRSTMTETRAVELGRKARRAIHRRTPR
jgi:hypothetical protein